MRRVRAAGDVLSYVEMCQDEGVNLQQGMNFRLRGGASVILMSLRPGAHVRVYEKVRTGIWVFNGVFRLVDAWAEEIEGRRVFKVRLEITEAGTVDEAKRESDFEPTRIILTSVKLEVWKRDQGQCVECGSADNLHFVHIIPWSRGGSSLTAENVQLLCARHNLGRHDRIV